MEIFLSFLAIILVFICFYVYRKNKSKKVLLEKEQRLAAEVKLQESLKNASKLKEQLLSSTPYLEAIDSAISEVFKILEEADRASIQTQTRLKQQTDKIDFDQEPLEFWVAKLAELVLVERLIYGLGLGIYKDEIMSAAIAASLMPTDKPLAPAAPQSLLNHLAHRDDNQEEQINHNIKEKQKEKDTYIPKSKRKEINKK